MKKIFILSLFCTILVSCNKFETLDDNTLKDNNQADEKILVFTSFDEYVAARNSSLSMSISELKDFEKSKGFNSFGRKCDEYCLQIDPEKFKSLEEIKAYINKNSEFIQLIKDDEGELTLEPILYKSIDRYIINKGKMYQIANNVYKESCLRIKKI
jgi:hypothetical protein